MTNENPENTSRKNEGYDFLNDCEIDAEKERLSEEYKRKSRLYLITCVSLSAAVTVGLILKIAGWL